MNDKVSGIKISNPDRIVYKNNGITKLNLAEYYNNIAKRMLPFLQNKVLSVIRCHGDVNGEKFFKKHPNPTENVEKIIVKKGQPFFYIKDKKQLISQVQMGTIEFHTWASDVTKPNMPNIMIFDLDPDEKLPHNKLCQGALILKKVLFQIGLKSFLKTSGGKGYHVVVPLKNVKNYKKFTDFAQKIAIFMENTSNLFTTNIKKEARKGKIFIDYLRNKKGSTCVCAYSLRARNGAPISMPIPWQKIKQIKPNQITILNYKDYLNNSWSNFFKIDQTIE